MNIAALVVCYNDGYKLNEWVENYLEYKDAIYRLFIIDNGSEKSFLDNVKNKFADATIIELEKNMGSTGAYNAGIRAALKDDAVDAIMLIGNDIKILSADVIKLGQALSDNAKVGMVAPVLLNKDCQIIADAGCELSYCFVLKPRHKDEMYQKGLVANDYVVALTGGMNLATRQFYESVGLQDERLFMYSDEADMAIRAQKNGFKMMIVGDAVAWHQHINPTKTSDRLPYSSYLIARNKVYLGKKHYGKVRGLIVFLYFIFLKTGLYCRDRIKHINPIREIYAIKGAWSGLKNDMSLPEKMQLN